MATVAVTAAGADWPRFLGPNADGTTAERCAWPPRLLWSVPVGEGYSAPTVAGGGVYHFDRVDDRCRLRALDAATGKELWAASYPTDYVDQFGYDGGPRSSPVVDHNRVFGLGPDGILLAADATSGKELWRIDTRAKYHVVPNFFGVGSTPWVEGPLLIVAVGGSPPGSAPADFRNLKSNGTALVAFDVATGAERWRCGQELASYASPVVVQRGERRQGYYFARGGLLAFDPITGRQHWHFAWRASSLESANAANPVIAGDRVLVSETYGSGAALLDVNAGEPKVIWSDAGKFRGKSLEAHWTTPILIDGHVFACSGRHTSNAELRCVELASGTIKWREPGLARTQLLAAAGELIVLSEYGVLLRLKATPQRYEELGRIDLGVQGTRLLKPPSWAGPVLANGKLYLRGEKLLACFDVSVARTK